MTVYQQALVDRLEMNIRGFEKLGMKKEAEVCKAKVKSIKESASKS